MQAAFQLPISLNNRAMRLLKIKTSIFCLLLASSNLIFSQVGINTNSPDQSALLDVVENTTDNNKGLLIPRVKLTGATDITTIKNPATGLLVYNISKNEDGTNGTPATDDDVFQNNFYHFANGRWNLWDRAQWVAEKLRYSAPKIVCLANLKPKIATECESNPPNGTYTASDFGVCPNAPSFKFVSSPVASTTSGKSIRKFMFDNVIWNPNNAYNLATGIFTAPQNGFYLININILLKPYANNLDANDNRFTGNGGANGIGASNPPPATLLGVGISLPNNFNSFYGKYLAYDTAQGANMTTYGHYDTIMYLTQGQQIVPLVQNITPGSATYNNNGLGKGLYSVDVEVNGYTRDNANNMSITLLPEDHH